MIYNFSLNIFYFQQKTSYTVQYIQFIRKLGLERKRKLIEFFSYLQFYTRKFCLSKRMLSLVFFNKAWYFMEMFHMKYKLIRLLKAGIEFEIDICCKFDGALWVYRIFFM